MKLCEMFETLELPMATLTSNDSVGSTGTVENVNEEPPFEFNREIPLSLGDDTTKSLGTAVMGPRASEALIVHVTMSKIRSGLSALHEIVDAVVGIPYTTYDTPLPLIAAPCITTLTKNAVVNVAGVAKNSYVNPPSLDVGVSASELDDEIKKSDAIPVVGPSLSLTLIVH